jgi:TolB-like protein/tRNA A-37 threonylcarbamoyl transferase component Bud32
MPSDIEHLRAALTGRYEVDRELGAGGMATVYLARDPKHNRQVAIKVLRPELASALGPDRFSREIRIVAQLNHPHILGLHDSGEADGFLYFVMPLIEGESLRDRLGRKAEMSLTEATRIIREVADALAYAHGRGIVHRDIKPGNVLISGRHALVTDFGVAKAVTSAAINQDTLTTVGVALGTPTYMAPEQAMGDAAVDHRADIYAVGALAYELLAGRPPFTGATAQAVLVAHVTEPPQPLAELRPAGPPALSDLIMQCLAKAPGDRPQSAEAIVTTLENLGTPSGGVTPTDTRPIQVVRPPPGRRRWMVGAVAAGLIAVAGFEGWRVLGGPGGPQPIERIAFMPIQDLSGSDQAFVNALHVAAINDLAQAGVDIVSAEAVRPYRDATQTAREIAQALGVQALVQGNVFRNADRIRMTVQLVEPATSRHLWSQTYERAVTDVMQVQDEIADSITVQLGRALAKERAANHQ